MNQPDLNMQPANLTARVNSIDLLRGLVMIIMALDHVRDYFHAPAFLYDPTDISRTTIPIFFTRFITHYCAPTFMLLSGTSAYLVGIRKGKKALSRFLLTRGLWLVLLELTIVNFGWFFDIQYGNSGFLVIWALGVSMIFLAALIHLPKIAILIISLAMICLHNLLDGLSFPPQSAASVAWSFIHQPNFFQWKGINIFEGYPLVPWIGVMSLGYCLGTLYEPGFDASKRKRSLLMLGLGCVIVFIALRYSNAYGDPFHWQQQKIAGMTLMSFLVLNKYPPSLLYLLITIGPSLMFLSFSEKINNGLSKAIQVIGRVPMFYYLVHIYLIHIAAMIVAEFSAGHDWRDMILTNWVSFEPKLAGFGFNLATVYVIWMSLVIILYFLCRWYDRYKRTHKHWWLSYL